jgi:hypothetical protein
LIYGGGTDYGVTRHLSLRAEYCGFVYKIPDFGLSNLNSDVTAHTAQPSAGGLLVDKTGRPQMGAARLLGNVLLASLVAVDRVLRFFRGHYSICDHLVVRNGRCVAVQSRHLGRGCGIFHHCDFEALF